MKKFEVYFNIPSPYRVYLLRALWKELSARGIDFEAHFMSRGHADRPDSWRNPKMEFPHRYWRDFGVGQRHLNLGLMLHSILHPATWAWNGSPYDTFTGIVLALFGRSSNKIVGAEGNTKTPGIMTGFVGWFKHLIYSRCRFAAVPGSDAVKFMAMHQSHTKMKMPMPVVIPNLIDESRFMPREKWPREVIAERRETMSVKSDDERICLIPARLARVKGLVPFVGQLCPEWLNGWKIVILGQGELKDEILLTARQRHVEDKLVILDYVPYDEMPSYYAAADLVLLPSIYDPNPLTVPEALFTGLPIALTEQAGNLEEGITERRNGWMLPVLNHSEFGETLRTVFATQLGQLREMGRYSLEHNSVFWQTRTAVRRFLDGVGAIELRGDK